MPATTALALDAPQGMAAEQEKTAAADPATALVLPLLLHLRSDRCPEAITAHLALVKQVRSDLAECGIANPHHLKLVELLYGYLDTSDWHFSVEEWVGDALMIDSVGRWKYISRGAA